MLPYDKSKALFDRELAPEDRSVRGNLVVGLSQSDIELLDVFEAEVISIQVSLSIALAVVRTSFLTTNRRSMSA